MTFAACVTETVGSPEVATAGELCAALTFGSLPAVADSLDGVAAAMDGADAVLLSDGGRSAVATFGGTSAADGGTEPTDAVAEALADADGEDEGACVAGVGETVGVSELGATTRGAGDSTFVTVGSGAAVGDAGATAAVVVCVTGGGAGATGSIACCVCCCVCGAGSTGAAGAMTGAFGGA